jgi:hypothetical protein
VPGPSGPDFQPGSAHHRGSRLGLSATRKATSTSWPPTTSGKSQADVESTGDGRKPRFTDTGRAAEL